MRRVALLCLLLALPAYGQADEPGTYAGRDASWWVGQLADEEAWKAARAALEKIGRPALEPLAEALTGKDPAVRKRALAVLRSLLVSKAPIVDHLVAALDPDDLRFTTDLLSLIQGTGPAAIPHLDTLVPYLACERRAAANLVRQLLYSLGPRADRVLPEVLMMAREGAAPARAMAVCAAIFLAPGSGEVVRAFGEVLPTAGDDDRKQLLFSAGNLRPDAPGYADLLARFSTSERPDIRKWVAGSLDAVVLLSRDRLPVLLALLEDPDAGVRTSAAWSVGDLGTIAAAATPALTELVRNDTPEDDRAAVRALAAIGPAGPAADSAVLELLARTASSDHMLRDSIRKYVARDRDLVFRMLGHEEPLVRRTAFRIIESFGTEFWSEQATEHLDTIGRALSSATGPGGWEIRVLVRLQQYHGRDPRLTPLYLGLARSPSEHVRKHATTQLALRPDAVPGLLALLDSEDSRDRTFALETFMVEQTALRGPAMWDGLFARLRGENAAARDLAGRILARHYRFRDVADLPEADARDYAEALADRIREEENPAIALNRMGAMGRYARPYLDLLFEQLAEGRGASALHRIAHRDPESAKRITPILEAALRGENAVVAAAVATTLAWGDDYDAEIVTLLPGLLRDPRPEVHIKAVHACEALGEDARPLVPPLLDLAEKPPEGSHVQWVAIRALSGLDPENERLLAVSVKLLLEGKRGGSHHLALSRGGQPAARVLAGALEDADTRQKLAILSALGGLGEDARCVHDDIRKLVDHPDAEVAKRAARIVEGLEQSR